MRQASFRTEAPSSRAVLANPHGEPPGRRRSIHALADFDRPPLVDDRLIRDSSSAHL
jgi:hypothetical protein